MQDNSAISEEEVLQAEYALIRLAQDHAVIPPPLLRDKILEKIKTLDKGMKNVKELDLNNLPLLDENSNWLDWQKTVNGIEPPGDYDGIHLHSLESNDRRELFVAWVKEYIEEEVHYDLVESFILLEGACECHITDLNGNPRVIRMGVGDFISMPVGEVHDIIITSLEPVKAILQWKKIA